MKNLSSDENGKLTLSQYAIEQLAARVDGWVEAGKQQHGDIGERWKVNEAFYRNQPTRKASRVFPDAEQYHMPLVQPKIDALTGNVSQSILSQSPYLICRLRGPRSDRMEDVEADLQYLFETGAFDVVFDEALLLAALCGVGIIRTTFKLEVEGFGAQHEQTALALNEEIITDEGPIKVRYAGIEFVAIHPADFIVYPANVKVMSGAKMVGHRYYRRVQEIEEMQKSGEYYNWVDPIAGGDSPTEEASGRDYAYAGGNPTVSIDEPKDELVRCWSLIVRLDLNEDGIEERYVIEFAESMSQILRIEKYDELSRPWYVDIRFHQEYGGFFPAGSPAQNLQGLQLMNTEILNLLLDGSLFGAFPPVFVDGNAFNVNIQRSYKPGEIIPTEGGMTPYSPLSRFDPGALPLVAQYVSQAADQAVRISMNGVGSQLRSGTTATEVAQIAAGQNQGLNRYIQMVGMGVVQIGVLILELYRLNFDMLKALHGDALLCNEPPPDQIRVELNGKVPMNTAAARMANAIQLLQALAPMAAQIGIDLRQLVKAVVDASELPNSEKFLIPEEELAMMMMQQQEAMNGTGPDGSQGMVGTEGGGLPPGNPGGEGGLDPAQIEQLLALFGGGGDMQEPGRV